MDEYVWKYSACVIYPEKFQNEAKKRIQTLRNHSISCSSYQLEEIFQDGTADFENIMEFCERIIFFHSAACELLNMKIFLMLEQHHQKYSDSVFVVFCLDASQKFKDTFPSESLNNVKLNQKIISLFSASVCLNLKYINYRTATPGHTSGISYFNGLLQLILPDFQVKIHPFSEKFNVTNKFIIVLPEFLDSLPILESDKVTQTTESLVRNASRANRKDRDYSLPWYMFTDENSKEHLFLMDTPAILKSFCEAQRDGTYGFSKDDLSLIRRDFHLMLEARLGHPSQASCRGNYVIAVCPEDLREDKTQGPSPLEECLERAILEAESDSFGATFVKQPYFSRTDSFIINDSIAATAPYRDKDCYKMSSNTRGICAIFAYGKFMGKSMQSSIPDRKGVVSDQKMLVEAFTKLKFKVEIFRDLDSVATLAQFQRLSELDHEPYDAFACCLLSHGISGHIYTTECKPNPVNEFYEYFNDKNCPTLKGKPKLFFIDVCQDKTVDHHEVLYEVTEAVPAIEDFSVPGSSKDDNSNIRFIENDDFLLSYSAWPGTKASGDMIKGSYYVQCLIKVLEKTNDNVRELLTKLKKDVEEKTRSPEEQKGQKTILVDTLTKLLLWTTNDDPF